MAQRWRILAVLFVARTTMAFQFQSVGALAPLMVDGYGLSLADIGLLVGLYMGPGVVIAYPGGALAARLGDKRIVGLGLGLMIAGGVLTIVATGWNGLMVGRVLAGVGGVVLNVVMTKMITDWFAGREISTAMALFINSWPLGIALALLTLPWLTAFGGLALGWAIVAGFVAIATAIFIVGYHAPPGLAKAEAGAPRSSPVTPVPMAAILGAGVVWGAFNAALATVISFGPLYLTGLDWPLSAASGAVSTSLICLAVVGPFGGYLADRSGRIATVVGIAMAGFALGIWAITIAPGWALPLVFAGLGAIAGVGAGPIMALPSLVLAPDNRAQGMGVFFTLYYAFMLAGPAMAGWLAERMGSVATALSFAIVLQVVCVIALWIFARAARTQKTA